MRKRTTTTLTVETGALVYDVRAIVARSSTRARALSDLGAAVENTVGELFHDAGALELRSVATQLQASVHYVISLALELAVHAGKLEQAASFYEAAAAAAGDD
jgi:hypothetical protein